MNRTPSKTCRPSNSNNNSKECISKKPQSINNNSKESNSKKPQPITNGCAKNSGNLVNGISEEKQNEITELKLTFLNLIMSKKYEEALIICENLQKLIPNDKIVKEYSKPLKEMIELKQTESSESEEESEDELNSEADSGNEDESTDDDSSQSDDK